MKLEQIALNEFWAKGGIEIPQDTEFIMGMYNVPMPEFDMDKIELINDRDRGYFLEGMKKTAGGLEVYRYNIITKEWDLVIEPGTFRKNSQYSIDNSKYYLPSKDLNRFA